MKNKETLEEAFDKIDDKFIRYSTEESEFWTHYKIGVMDGLQYKQERSYSEVFEWLSNMDYLSDKVDIIQKEFEQFKKL